MGLFTDVPDRTPEESVILARILEYVRRRRDVFVWRANTGVAFNSSGRPIRFGHVGQGDISGIINDGRRLEIEVKSNSGHLSPEQIAFQNTIVRFGGVFIVARSVADVERELDAAIGVKR